MGANVTTYANTGLAASTSYSYRVRAYNTAGDSDYSNTATDVTQAAPGLPAAPTNLVATVISKSQINLAWTDNSGNETGFKIERCKGSTCTNFAQIASVGANVTSYSNTGLAKNTTYRYRVRAYNASRQLGVLEHRCGHDAEILRGTPARRVPFPLPGLGGHPPPRPAQPPATDLGAGSGRATVGPAAFSPASRIDPSASEPLEAPEVVVERLQRRRDFPLVLHDVPLERRRPSRRPS